MKIQIETATLNHDWSVYSVYADQPPNTHMYAGVMVTEFKE